MTNPYEPPKFDDDQVEPIQSAGPQRSIFRPSNPGKVACGCIFASASITLGLTLFLRGGVGAMIVLSDAGFWTMIGCAVCLYFGSELARKLTLLVSTMYLMAIISFLGLVFLGPLYLLFSDETSELTGISFVWFGVEWSSFDAKSFTLVGLLSAVIPAYVLWILWGRMCNGLPVQPRGRLKNS